MRSTLPRPKKLVCVAIADHVDKFGEGCYASYGTLAEETSYEERQVMRIVTELEQDGIIVYQGKHPAIRHQCLEHRQGQAAHASSTPARSGNVSSADEASL
ncbi:MAG: helix-turn-helix domain-containing protein [Anaerolineae bacterium]